MDGSAVRKRCATIVGNAEKDFQNVGINVNWILTIRTALWNLNVVYRKDASIGGSRCQSVGALLLVVVIDDSFVQSKKR